MRVLDPDRRLREMQPSRELCRLYHGIDCGLCSRPVARMTDEEFDKWLRMRRREWDAGMARVEEIFRRAGV